MSKPAPRSIESVGSGSIGSQRQRSAEARGEHSASNQASFDDSNYDTALPPMQFNQACLAHRRTGSTLKTVMRKIFNRKRESQTDGLEKSPHAPYYASPPARRSGPTVGKSFLAMPTPSESKRSSPLSEVNLQLSETHLSPTSLTAGNLPSPGPHRRRRATLPSVIFSDDGSQYGVPSTAISDPQEDRSYTADQQLRPDLLQDRRRSRSTYALRSLAHDQPIPPASWRQRTASMPTSAPDSKSPPLEGSSASGRSRRPSTGTTVTSVTRASAGPSMPDSDQHPERMSGLPNVANLVRSMQQDDGLTVEQRLNTLEVKMIDLEFAIARMQSNSVGDAPLSRSSRQKQGPSPDSSTLHTRNKPSSGFLGSVDREESPPSPLTNLHAGRPRSTSTIRPETMNSRTLRPAPSATSLSTDFGGVSIEQYSTLVTLLRREQTARRNLESQVSSLHDELRQIQRAALHSMELGTKYPIHSVDSHEFLRFRRAFDDSASSSPIRTAEDRANEKSDDCSEWDRSDYAGDDPFGPSTWEHGQRIVTAPLI